MAGRSAGTVLDAVVRLGRGAYTNLTDGIAIGRGASARGLYGTSKNIAIGVGSTTAVAADSATAVGASATASGANSATAVGASATASGAYATSVGVSTIANSSASTAVGASAFSGGINSTAIGQGTSASTTQATAVGSSATASATNSTAVGSNAQATASSATALGTSAAASGVSSVALSTASAATRQSQLSYGPISHAAAGDCQFSVWVLRKITTDATATEVALDGTTTYLTVPASRTLAFTIKLAAARTDATGDRAAWPAIQGAITRDSSGNCRLLGSVTGAGTTTLSDAGAATWTVAVTADTSNNRLAITVTGEASKTIRWTAIVEAADLGG